MFCKCLVFVRIFFFHLEGVRCMFVNKTRGPLAKTMWTQLPTNATCGEGAPQPLSLPEGKNGTFNRVVLLCIQWGTYVWSLEFWVWFFRAQRCDWCNDIDFLASCKIATKFTQRISRPEMWLRCSQISTPCFLSGASKYIRSIPLHVYSQPTCSERLWAASHESATRRKESNFHI